MSVSELFFAENRAVSGFLRFLRIVWVKTLDSPGRLLWSSGRCDSGDCVR